MGDPKRHRRKYVTPPRPWDKVRLEKEVEYIIKYGLRNKRELWRSQNILRKYRRVARELLAKIDLPGKEGELAKAKAQMVIKKLIKMGILEEGATIDDILNLTVDAFLSRRLQTIVFKQGLANTIKQARQLITHGHIAIDGVRVTVPGRLVTKEEETKISYYQNSPFAKREIVVRAEKAETAET
ncbi:SSU ribosomal protein S4P [Archaeoglobus sulfaticallidus PM70-1]|uniref:Small ribosomal subunit protein uS4 n=1 Tax=Archaeoglobus sulfaticallidus PM70-1 TaxID=387631 RepID=N0BEF7_9EURY|nr:30S ribosomal protein S4 [Archaeoglobus sulfaticallidus]AGK60642.1 SSU ribosomal protein S4P [Archaeoglobus sulfaticallidus PM70-1]